MQQSAAVSSLFVVKFSEINIAELDVAFIGPSC
jgi:hypothetical protein